MSMMNASYRRDHPTIRVPVVMPLVEVTIAQDGHAAVRLNGEPYNVDGSLTRSDVSTVLDQIALELGTAVRAELIECDGERFTDYVTPGSAPLSPAFTNDVTPVSRPTHSEPGGVRPLLLSAFGVTGSGFTAGEVVEVCVVVTTQVADADGQAFVRVPPALLATHPDVVLVGRSSGTVATGSVRADADSA